MRAAISAWKAPRSATNVTDDSATIAAEITAAYTSGRTIVLPAGRCKVTNLTITKSVRIAGHGDRQTFLVSPNGSTNPIITVDVTTNGGFYPAIVSLGDLAITSQSKTDVPGQTLVHGIRLKSTAAVQTAVHLHNVSIDEVPGSCLYAAAGEAADVFVAGYNSNCLLPNQYGIYANSTSDWLWVGGLIYGATLDNIVCAECSNFHFERA